MIRRALAGALFLGTQCAAAEPAGLDQALSALAAGGQFSGAVVIQDARGLRFARGYGLADPFTGRAFTPDTPVDSGSLAKPVTAAAILALAQDGKLDLDAPVVRYIAEFPHRQTTVRQLLAHSAGLPFNDSPDALAGKSNADLIGEVAARRVAPAFEPGSAFAYCNLCYVALALLIERVSGQPYLAFARQRIVLPRGVAIRPARLAEWRGRAIGYRLRAAGKPERFDSWEGEAFYGSGNLSISALEMAEWGARWWGPRLTALHAVALRRATIAGKPSGLTLGNWYCAPDGRRCHYLGHHEGFHHMLYFDLDRRHSVAMVSNNTLSPALHQRLQRALVAFADDRPIAARRELGKPLAATPAKAGRYRLGIGVDIVLRGEGERMVVDRDGLAYPAYDVGGIRYVPGLDTYLAGGPDGTLRWLNLYEDRSLPPISGR